MVEITDPNNEWASFLGSVFLGLVLCVTIFAIIFNIVFGTNLKHLLLLHILLQINNALPLMRAIPPLYLSYFFNKITMLNWQVIPSKEFHSQIFGKAGKMSPYNFTFEMQNIKDMLFFINIFDMILATGVFFAMKFVFRLMEKAVMTRSLDQYTKFKKFNEQLSLFSYLRITWMFLNVYSMLNILKLTEGDSEVVDYVGGAVSVIVVIALFVYLFMNFRKIKKQDQPERRVLGICDGLKVEDRYMSSAWLLYLSKMMLISLLLIFIQPLTRIQALSITSCNIAMLLYICLKQVSFTFDLFLFSF